MKERPILFSAPMVRAIIEGRKTQTRRIVKWQGPRGFPYFFDRAFLDNPAGIKRLNVPYHHPSDPDDGDNNPAHRHYPPYGDPGDRLWVRETWAVDADLDQVRREHEDMMPGLGHGPYFRADPVHENTGLTWRPSIHMPRWASRITLEVVSVRVERLQEISEDDAQAEGVDAVSQNDMPRQATWSRRQDFAQLWDKINKKRAPFASNPWIWAVEFRRLA